MAIALVTGASAGIGKAFAQALAQRRYNLVLVARSEEKLQAIAQRLKGQTGVDVYILAQDLTVPEAAAQVFAAVEEKNLTVDLLVNNAGFGDYGGFSDSSRSKQLTMIQLNIAALVDLTYQFLPSMQQHGSGGIINLSSTAAFLPIPYMSVYGATKAFVLNFSEALWAENREKGVKVLAVCPGPVKTEFFQEAGFNDSAAPKIAGPVTTPEAVAQEALGAYDAAQSHIVTGGIYNQLVSILPRFLPRTNLLKFVEKQYRP